MSEEKIDVWLTEEEVQQIIDCYEKDIERIKQLEEKVLIQEAMLNDSVSKERYEKVQAMLQKITDCIEEYQKYYGDYMGDENYQMYDIMGAGNNRTPYIKVELIKEILGDDDER